MKNKHNQKNPIQNSQTAGAQTAPEINVAKNQNSSSIESHLAFDKSNFTIMVIGVVIILAGFFIMTLDKEPFGFGFLGITLGPIVAFVGFMVEFYAILKK